MLSTISPEQLLANRNNAKLSTGPKSKKGKQTVAKNATSHGLNQATCYADEPLYSPLLTLINQDGFSASDSEAIAQALTDYRKVMDAYYDTYTAIPPVNSIYSTNGLIIAEAIFTMAGGARDSVTPLEIKQVISLINNSRKQAQKQGLMPMRHATDMRRFMRYQQKAAASISKAICHSDNINPVDVRSSLSQHQKNKEITKKLKNI
jgi:hypothetical protein